jgi:hypothetical protein
MPYYKELNLLFIHIPKTGGTSLENYLKQKANQTVWSVGLRQNILFDNFQIETVSLHHLTYKDIYNYKNMLGIDFNDNLKIITIVRNPYHRIVSDLFFWDLIDENTSKNDVYEIVKKYVSETCYYHKGVKFYDYDNHNKPQYKFIVDDADNIMFNITIFKTETLNSDLQNYGFQDFQTFKGANKKNIHPDKYINYLNDDCIKLINEIYKKDFELFNYEIKNVL